MTALFCLCLCVPGDFFSPLPTQVVTYGHFTHTTEPGYGPPEGPFYLVGQGQGLASYRTFDTFAEYDLSTLSAPVTSFTLAGSIYDLQTVTGFHYGPPGIGTVYAYLTADVWAIAPTTTDAAGLFAAIDSGTEASSFTIDDYVAPTSIAPPGAPIGWDFTVNLSPAAVAIAEADRLARRPFWLGFTGLGQSGGGVEPVSFNVIGDLTLVPEPASLGLLLLGLPLLRRRR
jgi:hypothetical protein